MITVQISPIERCGAFISEQEFLSGNATGIPKRFMNTIRKIK
jgi:hypothetical protein